MTDYGITATGFRRKTYEEIVATVEAWERAKISKTLDLTPRTILGNLNAILSEHIEQVWEIAEAAYGALDPDNAVEALLVGLCKLTGIRRLAADYGHVTETLTFDKAATIPAGTLLLAVDGDSTNLWANDEEIVATGAGDVDAAFTSTQASSAATALAGTLTVIATPIGGLTAATNALDATPGTDQESLEDLRARREASLASTGRGTVAAVHSALAEVDGVVDDYVIENDTDATVDGIPPHSIRCIIWDGTGEDAADVDVAQAIYDSKGAGRQTSGETVANAEDPWGASKPVRFDRADAIDIYVVVEVSGETTETAVQTAILAAHRETIGADVLYAALLSAAFGVDGVDDVVSLTVGTGAAPTGTSNIVIAADEVGVLDSTRIDVTVS